MRWLALCLMLLPLPVTAQDKAQTLADIKAKLHDALVAGLNLGRATLDTLSSDQAKQALVAATQLRDVADVSEGIALEKMDALGSIFTSE